MRTGAPLARGDEASPKRGARRLRRRQEFVRVGGWARAREGGNVWQEGKEYLVADGDVILCKFNV